MNTDHLIHDVSDTSFWVAYYRAKETERSNALFQDPFAQKLVGERGKKISDSMPGLSRYTEWSVVSRTVMIDRFIEKLIREGVEAVINLGAGLDTRPYRMNLPPDLEWIEVDYPNIIRHKKKILDSETPKCRLTRVELDLADAEKRNAFFQSAASRAKKVLILTEGVIPYLSPEQVAELGRDLFRQPRFSFWVSEYFSPRAYPYIQRRARVLKMRNAPFRFFPPDWFGFFKPLGWIQRETRYGGEIAKEFHRKLPMPWFAQLLLPLLPKRFREESLRMAGYSILERSS